MAIEKSLGGVSRAGWNAQVVPMIPNRVATLAPGLCAMLIAAVAVSVGCVLPFVAFAKSVVHGVEEGPAELMQAPRMSATVSMVDCGTNPLPFGVVGNDTPRPRDSRLVTVANALGTSVAVARVELELDTWVESVAKPAMEKAVVTVEISL